MKKLLNYFKEFHRDYFNVYLYVVVALFITALIVFNYRFDFEDSVIDSYYGKPIRIFYYFLYHGLGYFGVLMLIKVFRGKLLKLTPSFWLKSMLGMLILATDRGVYPFVSKLFLSDIPSESYRFWFKVLFNAYGLVTVTLSLALMSFIFDRYSSDGIYGLKFKKVDFRIYWIMFLFMVPVIFIAAYLPDIADYYPTYKRTGGARFAAFHQIPEWISIVIYEVVYLLDFINTEIFFRGFLIIGLAKFLGKDAILPMVATYAVLHFGKPMGETISSVFGGYILGVIALYSRNIWGGIFIHGGIALLMELFGSMR